MNTLGERIRNLRKKHRLTLEACAGDQMTKGMLSLIENNKANPSIENLQYLARRLEVEISELWGEISIQEFQELLHEGEQLLKEQVEPDYNAWIEKIKPFLPKLTQGYEAARLLEIYSRILHYLQLEGWQDTADRASTIYDDLNITARQAGMVLFRVNVLFAQHQYQEALQKLLNERMLIERQGDYIDALTKLDLDYYEAIMRFAVGDSKEAIRVMNKAIHYSKKERIFYRIDHLYRLAAFQAMNDKDQEDFYYYEKKLQQYSDFAEDNITKWILCFIQIHYVIDNDKDYTKALELINNALVEHVMDEVSLDFLRIQEGKALYGLKRYEEAIEVFKGVCIHHSIHHPFDLSILYVKDAYRALCEQVIGNEKIAKQLVKIAKQNMQLMPDSPYKEFVEIVYYQINKENI